MARKQQTKTAGDVKAELAERQGRDTPTREYTQPLDKLLASSEMQAQLARAVPRSVDLDRLLRVLLTVVRQNPQLMRCEVPTVLGALMQCAQLGLEPGPLEEAYFVPFKNGQLSRQRGRDVYECQFILGYKGIVKLALQSPTVEDIVGRVVYEGDDFDVAYGSQQRIEHRPRFRTIDPAKITHAYAVATFVGAGKALVALSREEVESRRARSPAARAGRGSPWDTDYAAMAAKTPVRALRPWLPLTTQLADALAADDRTSRWTAEMDGPIVDVLPPTPEELARGETAGEVTEGDGSGSATRDEVQETGNGEATDDEQREHEAKQSRKKGGGGKGRQAKPEPEPRDRDAEVLVAALGDMLPEVRALALEHDRSDHLGVMRDIAAGIVAGTLVLSGKQLETPNGEPVDLPDADGEHVTTDQLEALLRAAEEDSDG